MANYYIFTILQKLQKVGKYFIWKLNLTIYKDTNAEIVIPTIFENKMDKVVIIPSSLS